MFTIFSNVIVQNFKCHHYARKLKTNLYFNNLNVMKGIRSRSYEKQWDRFIALYVVMSKSRVKADEKSKKSFSCLCHSGIFYSAKWLRERKQNNNSVIATSVFYFCFKGEKNVQRDPLMKPWICVILILY